MAINHLISKKLDKNNQKCTEIDNIMDLIQ